MEKKYYTFIVAQPRYGKVRKLMVPHTVLYAAVSACLLGFAIITILLLNFGRMALKVNEFNRLRSEFLSLKTQNQFYQSSTSQLFEEFSLLESLAQRVSEAAGLETSRRKGTPPSRQGLGRLVRSSFEVQGGEVSEQLQRLSRDTDHLEARFRRLENHYDRIELRRVRIPNIWPVEGSLSDRFGVRRTLWDVDEPEIHKGIDIAAKYGNKVLAAADGTVVTVERQTGYGNVVTLDHGFGISTLYAHLAAFSVHPGQKVRRGETIGIVGVTGRATGPHLHYEVRKHGSPVNPLRYISRSS